MRTLFYVPMIHTDQELNELGAIIKGLRERVYGPAASDRDAQALGDLWEVTRSWVLQEVGDPGGLVIYQDGIPVGPREKIRALFSLVLAEHPESPLFQLTKELLDRGAVLEGTEDFNLLVGRVNAYRRIYQVVERCQDLQDVESYIVHEIEGLDHLIPQADQFIANRVDETLPENGRGILFVGYRHQVDEELIRRQRAGLLSSPITIYKLNLEIVKSG